jgi:hypothetical protein
MLQKRKMAEQPTPKSETEASEEQAELTPVPQQEEVEAGTTEKRQRVTPSTTEEEGGAQGEKESTSAAGELTYDYDMHWDKFAELSEEGRVHLVTGVKPTGYYCDEPVSEELVRRGLAFLNSLAEAGPWHEDAQAGATRTSQVSASPQLECAVVRVYHSSSLEAQPECNRYELTYLSHEDNFQYVAPLCLIR